MPRETRPPEISYAVIEAFASTAGGRNVTGETSVPSSIVEVARERGDHGPGVERGTARLRLREVVVGAEQGLDAVLLARLGEGEPVLPRHALLPFDHQRQAHRASYGDEWTSSLVAILLAVFVLEEPSGPGSPSSPARRSS